MRISGSAEGIEVYLAALNDFDKWLTAVISAEPRSIKRGDKNMQSNEKAPE